MRSEEKGGEEMVDEVRGEGRGGDGGPHYPPPRLPNLVASFLSRLSVVEVFGPLP